MWNVECEISRTSCDVELFNYKLLFNIHYSIAMQFHRVLPSGRNFSTLVEKIIKKMWNYEL